MSRSIVLLTTVLLFACKSTTLPDNILPPAKMEAVMLDMLNADEFVNGYVLIDTAKNRKTEHIKMYEQVFLIHKIDKKTFYSSLKYYQQHPDLNKVLVDSLVSVAARHRDSTMTLKPMEPAAK